MESVINIKPSNRWLDENVDYTMTSRFEDLSLSSWVQTYALFLCLSQHKL